jgi:hypothetical protein
MKAISVRQPWASLIIEGHKKMELRNWKPNLKLPAKLAIHASKSRDFDQYAVNAIRALDQDASESQARPGQVPGILNRKRPGKDATAVTQIIQQLPRGAIIGEVEVWGVHEFASSQDYADFDREHLFRLSWRELEEEAYARFGWRLRNPEKYAHLREATGRIGIFNVPPGL